MAEEMARICVYNALFFGNKQFSNLIIPWCTFTDPEIAHVGLYPSDIEARGLKASTFEKEFADNDRSRCEGSQYEEGFIRVYTKDGSNSGKILGCTIVGQNAGDLISEITVMMATDTGLKQASTIIHPYPTRADIIRRVGDAFYLKGFSVFSRRIIKGIFSLSA
jgi:pyruvate/2-oxoglutarate dehydrogenase complex dihydrolipoamide dehydrogenase (E3) component